MSAHSGRVETRRPVKKRLAEYFDLSEAALARLHGPVGLRLGARTPAEIAVPIVAELVQMKNKGASDAMQPPSTYARGLYPEGMQSCPI